MISQLTIPLAVITFCGALSGNAAAQGEDTHAAGANQRVLSLTFADNRNNITAQVGQQVEIKLGTVGPKEYGTPLVSSTAIHLESIALATPLNPGGPTRIYIFKATAEGEATIKIPIIHSKDPDWNDPLSFAVTVQINPVSGEPLDSSVTEDQANAGAWTKGWTNLLNEVEQTFTPSMQRLTGVEVALVEANPGPPDDEITMYLLNAKGDLLAVVSKIVPVAECGRVLFVFPSGGLQVSPGETYRVRLSGRSLYGWKYVVGGYEKGEALFNGKPLLTDARSTFLFRTFGTN